MQMSIRKEELIDYIRCQLNHFFPDKNAVSKDEIKKPFDVALQRCEYCFSRVKSRYYADGKDVLFNHLNGDQYAMFLYFLCNSGYKNDCDIKLCTKVFLLNKYLHGIDAFCEVELPDIFLFVHPLGTVLGRAKYGNYLLVYQRCNVGSNRDIYPAIGEYVSLHPGSSILGDCRVEENCKIAAGSLLLDRNLEKDSLYVGNPRDFIIKKNENRNPVWQT